MIRSIGILGSGRFVTFLEDVIKKFFPMIEIKTAMPEAAACDVVVVAVPPAEFETTITQLVSLMHKDAVIIDAEATKTYTTPILKRVAIGRPYISMQPMFGPLSYTKHPDLDGFRIVIAEQTLAGVLYLLVITALKQWGIKIVGMTPESADEYLARSLFCTHFPQQAGDNGLAVTDHDTIYFGDLIDGEDAYRRNPFFEAIRQRLDIPKEEIEKLLKV